MSFRGRSSADIFSDGMPEDCQFSPAMLLEAVEAGGRSLGLVIDLTKTDRFYDKAELISRRVGHYKLKCEGYVCSVA